MSVDLLSLLPSIYRIRDAQLVAGVQLLNDAEQAELAALRALTAPASDQQARIDELNAKATRGPLQSLLMVIGEQVDAIDEELEQLYDDQFIETCAPWVIPYIGDLIGYRSVKGIAPAIDNPRSEVARTLSLRRRKGTVLVLEELARDVTGWGAHAVEFFQVLADMQYMKHIRRAAILTPEVRRWQTRVFMNTAFDRTAHHADAHRIATGLGRYNVHNVGVFLWTLNAYSVTRASPAAEGAPVAGAPACFRFSPLGMDVPLFHRANPRTGELTAPAAPADVPDRLLRRPLCEDLRLGVGASFYGEGKSLALYKNGRLLNPYEICVANLSDVGGSWAHAATADPAYAALVDPELGRIVLPVQTGDSGAPQLVVSWQRAFFGDMGGGEYAREAGFTVTDPAWVFPWPDTATPPRYPTLQDALAFTVKALAEHGAVALEVAGSITVDAGTPLSVDLPEGTTLELRAADGAAPTLFLEGELSVSGGDTSSFVLDGFVLAAGAAMSPGNPVPTAPASLVHAPAYRPDGSVNLLGTLELRHCTFVPGWSVGPDGAPRFLDAPALLVEPAGTNLSAQRAILGALSVAPLATTQLTDCIVDATGPTRVAYCAPVGSATSAAGGGALTLDGCTVIGKTHAALLTLVSDSIFFGACASGDGWTSALVADRRQEGCVRFSFLPVNARTPRRFRCVEAALAAPHPVFRALRYGDPAYLQLHPATDDTIRRGADDGGEMGAFHFVLAPLREDDLGVRIGEYLPVGLEYGLIRET